MNSSIVRAVIAIIFAIAVAVGFFVDKVSAEVFLTLAGSAITYFFTKDTQESATKAAIAAMSASPVKVVNLDAQKTQTP